jgi:hypothetical protein
MWYITVDSYFLLFILHILLFNRCVVINHTNICLDLFFRKSIFHVLIPQKNLPKFWPNFGNLTISMVAGIFAILKIKTLEPSALHPRMPEQCVTFLPYCIGKILFQRRINATACGSHCNLCNTWSTFETFRCSIWNIHLKANETLEICV